MVERDSSFLSLFLFSLYSAAPASHVRSEPLSAREGQIADSGECLKAVGSRQRSQERKNRRFFFACVLFNVRKPTEASFSFGVLGEQRRGEEKRQ